MLTRAGGCAIKQCGLVIYRFCNKLVCLSKQACLCKLLCFVTGNRKDTI